MGLDLFLAVKRNTERFDIAYWHNAYDICGWFERNLLSIADGTGYADPTDWGPDSIIEPPDGGVCENGYYYSVTKNEFEQLLKVCRDALTKKDRPNEIAPEIQPDALKDDLDLYWEHINLTVEQLESAE